MWSDGCTTVLQAIFQIHIFLKYFCFFLFKINIFLISDVFRVFQNSHFFQISTFFSNFHFFFFFKFLYFFLNSPFFGDSLFVLQNFRLPTCSTKTAKVKKVPKAKKVSTKRTHSGLCSATSDTTKPTGVTL